MLMNTTFLGDSFSIKWQSRGAWAKYKPANYEKSVKFFTSSPNVLYYTLVA